MSLIAPGTQVAPEKLAEIYREHREAIAEIAGTLDDPTLPVTDPARWMNAEGLATDVLRLFPEDPAKVPEGRLVEYVNASYVVMITLIDQRKRAFGLPNVPRPRP